MTVFLGSIRTEVRVTLSTRRAVQISVQSVAHIGETGLVLHTTIINNDTVLVINPGGPMSTITSSCTTDVHNTAGSDSVCGQAIVVW